MVTPCGNNKHHVAIRPSDAFPPQLQRRAATSCSVDVFMTCACKNWRFSFVKHEKNASMWVIVTAAAARWCHVFYCLLYFWTHPMLPHPGPKKIKTRNKMHDLCFYPVCPFSLKDVARSSAWRRMYPSTAHPQCFHHVWSYMVARFSFAELLRKHVKVGFWFKHVFFQKTCFSQRAENCALNMMRNQRFCWGGVGC